jgi:hypothetical protein
MLRDKCPEAVSRFCPCIQARSTSFARSGRRGGLPAEGVDGRRGGRSGARSARRTALPFSRAIARSSRTLSPGPIESGSAGHPPGPRAPGTAARGRGPLHCPDREARSRFSQERRKLPQPADEELGVRDVPSLVKFAIQRRHHAGRLGFSRAAQHCPVDFYQTGKALPLRLSNSPDKPAAGLSFSPDRPP